MNNIINNVPFLRTSRGFPEEIHQLALEINKTYVDIANAVNNRTISIFPSNRPVINGESWFFNNNQRQQGFRQVYPFVGNGAAPVLITHGINVSQISTFVRISGVYTDNTNYYPLPFVDFSSVAIQVQLLVTATQINIIPGPAAPTIRTGIIILEWIVQP